MSNDDLFGIPKKPKDDFPNDEVADHAWLEANGLDWMISPSGPVFTKKQALALAGFAGKAPVEIKS